MTSGASFSRLPMLIMMWSDVLIMLNWSCRWNGCDLRQACPCEAPSTVVPSVGTGMPTTDVSNMFVIILLAIEVVVSLLHLSHHLMKKRKAFCQPWLDD